MQVEVVGQAFDSRQALATTATLILERLVAGGNEEYSPPLLHSHVYLAQVAVVGLIERVCRGSGAGRRREVRRYLSRTCWFFGWVRSADEQEFSRCSYRDRSVSSETASFGTQGLSRSVSNGLWAAGCLATSKPRRGRAGKRVAAILWLLL